MYKHVLANVFTVQPPDLASLSPGGRRSAFVFSLGLSFGNAFPLTLKHELAFKLSNGAKHI
jgi:hypothetical protein